MKKRVVIVGGGINGLTAANYLQKQNFDVKILEKNKPLFSYSGPFWAPSGPPLALPGLI